MPAVEPGRSLPPGQASPVAVFFDEQAFLMQSAGGISRYVCSLARELARTGEAEVLVFGGISANTHLLALAPGPGLSVRFRPRRDRLRINTLVSQLSRQWRRMTFRRFQHRHGRVIYHPSYYEVDSVIAARAAATVVTFHDMIPEWLAREHHADPGPLPAMKLEAARQATMLLANSEATRREVIKAYPDLKLNLAVTPLAAELPAISSSGPPPELAGHDYFLLVGNREGYKNGVLAFAAFAGMAAARPRLRLAGIGGEPLKPAESELLSQHGLLDRWIHLRGGDELLARCYRHAAALIYPSRCEGFGLPVVEAMQSGCPVITTACASLPEVGGGAVLYVDPDDSRALAKILESLLDNEEQRRGMIERGRDRARAFSWQATARGTLSAYHRALAGDSSAVDPNSSLP
jgi:glycosyltransferase involved in cell wall biosynthesis